ncbi:anti-sigma factor antagonist [Amycolatopsis deserti]|uniref:Anti-sigma factor antagonist n=1 Tax=Amycolatopsis deserti TaxID=185696 RepID=A0ABQ3I9T6_9PSEU|nr:STAS domain-containing protein [Amycolatopsis deserti]GHE75770.1 anti-sigma factor antagonist [Amycolatopsis deserti]
MASGPESVSGFEIEALRRAGAVVVRVAGEVDLAAVPWLRRFLARALADRPALLVVDLSGVEFLGIRAVSELVRARRAAGEATQVRVVAPGGASLRPLTLAGVTREVSVTATLAQALADR